mgnify:CR=1 FL=1
MTTNPIPKNGLFATLGMEAVAELIQSLPKKHQQTAYLIYFGTVNHCAVHIDKHLSLEVVKGITTKQRLERVTE